MLVISFEGKLQYLCVNPSAGTVLATGFTVEGFAARHCNRLHTGSAVQRGHTAAPVHMDPLLLPMPIGMRLRSEHMKCAFAVKHSLQLFWGPLHISARREVVK